MPLRRLARCNFGLFRARQRALTASLALLPHRVRASGKPIPCPDIMPTASVENTLELVTLSETL
jgi:hypothetical protein